MRSIHSLVIAAILTAWGSAVLAAPAPTVGPPVETAAANKPDAKPAFAGQTRVPSMSANVAFKVDTVATGLVYPWALVFMPDGRAMLTEKSGGLRIMEKDGKLSAPITGAPAVAYRAGGQGGLLGLALDPAFARNRRVYLSFSQQRPEGVGIAVQRGVLNAAGTALTDTKVIFQATVASSANNQGGRLLFDPTGALFVTVGDRFNNDDTAQKLTNDLGKVIRITTDGAPAPGNPYLNKPGALPEIYSSGQRNPEGATLDTKGRLWTIEHGPQGGDEVNIVLPGKDYGWGTVVYGVNYGGATIGAGITAKEGTEQPVYYWDPVIAPSGLTFYNANLFPAWKGSLFAGSMKQTHLVRLTMNGDKVIGEERLLADLKERIRDVVVGPEGALYLLTDSATGKVLKLTPK